MSEIAIRVDNLGKQYHIGRRAQQDRNLREIINDACAAPFRRLRGRTPIEEARERDATIWALKDVSFEVKHGEVVGIIGHNGSGKARC